MPNSPFAPPGRFPKNAARDARHNEIPAWFAEAVASHQAGCLGRAVELYQQILQREPGLPEVHNNLGAALAALGRLSDATQSYRRALDLNPGNAQAWCNWGTALASLGELGEAEDKLRRAVGLDARFVEAHSQLGHTLRRLGRLDAAEDMLRRALALDPNSAPAHANLGGLLLDGGRPSEAAAAFARAVALKPDFAAAHNNLALALKEVGRLEEAGRAAEQAIRLAPRRAAYYANLADVRTFATGDPHAAMLEALAQEATLPADERIHLHFALAKAYDDMGRPDAAFTQLRAGNALKRQAIIYDEATTLTRLERTRALFTPELIAARQGAGEPTRRPVFILGMPRSGTTLIEQILASHPDVCGAGEIKLLDQVVGAVRDRAPPAAMPSSRVAAYPDMVAGMGAQDFSWLGAAYEQELARRAPGARRVTDKMPPNFIYVGLIHLALPHATIIHAVRDPVDTCVSCFAKLFVEGQAYAYDLGELGRYYRHYRALMAQWHRVLPPGRILDVHYEDVVADLEGSARRILAHCGLPWDARCLDFHRNGRAVRTASAAQVRRPIYGHAVARWRKYERFLAPLLAELVPPYGDAPEERPAYPDTRPAAGEGALRRVLINQVAGCRPSSPT
ncbi:MAG TPA: sulfotransferase [Xanthobacteraceae bacterium]